MKLNRDLIQYIGLFEKITRTSVKNCFFYNEMLVFIVGENQGGKAVGAQGKNVKQLNTLLNKKIKVVEFNLEPVKFIKGFISPIVAEDINVEEKTMNVKVSSTRDKGVLIGRDRKNLNILKELVKKYFDLDDVKII